MFGGCHLPSASQQGERKNEQAAKNRGNSFRCEHFQIPGKGEGGLKTKRQTLSRGNLIDCVERMAVQQFFLVTRTKTRQIKLVHKTLIEFRKRDPG